MIKRFSQNNPVAALCVKLGVVVIMMFAFAMFVMPPLYDLFCDITGLNGKTNGVFTGSVSRPEADSSRVVKVRFLAANNGQMPWEFMPITKTVDVRLGEPTVVSYFARNTTGQAMVAQAVPSLSPSKAIRYFHKTECFCFNRQPLAAGESAELGLSFIVDYDIPKAVNSITLMYTLFDVTDQQETPKTSDSVMSSDDWQLADIND